MQRAPMKRPLKLGASHTVAFSPTGELLATAGRYVWIWDVGARSKRCRVHPFPHPSELAFSPDGSKLAVKNTSGRIVILDTEDGHCITDFGNRKDGEGSNILFSPCGGYVVDGSWDGHLQVRRVDTGETVFRREFQGEMLTDIHASNDRTRWIVEHHPKWRPGEDTSPPSYFSSWQWPFTESEMTILPLHVDDSKTSSVSGDGTRIAVMLQDSIQLHRLLDGALLRSVPIQRATTGNKITWSGDNELIGSVQEDKIVVYEANELTRIAQFPMEYPSDVAFSPTGEYLAFGDWSAGLMLSNTAISEESDG